MVDTNAAFYTAGGTLKADAPSYVERRADRELLSTLRKGEFCYVLDSRQKGKSSLMSRAILRLQQQGVSCVKLDLQRFGTNLDAERWYAGLLNALGQDLELSNELFEYWAANQRFGPLERWMGAIEAVVLPKVERRLCVFIDEIDFVRSLPFSTDEFFAGIREWFNRRSGDQKFAKVAFCLLGVATPSDLIRDVRITPFNVGKRIELTDFTLEEALQLAPGLRGRDRKVLIARIHYWTNGHPYLTQRLCQAVLEDRSVVGMEGVDRTVESIFLAAKAREEEPNLRDVSRRVLEGQPLGMDRNEYLAEILDLFASIRSSKHVKDDETDPLISVLKLSGITGVHEEYLLVRNRIYSSVFDSTWVQSNMPGAELRRQKAATRVGALRTTAIASILVVGFAALSAYALWETEKAGENALKAARGGDAAAKSAAAASEQAAKDEAAMAKEIAELKRAAARRAANEIGSRRDGKESDPKGANGRRLEEMANIASMNERLGAFESNQYDQIRKKIEAKYPNPHRAVAPNNLTGADTATLVDWAFTRNGKKVFALYPDRLYVYDVKTRKLLKELPVGGEAVSLTPNEDAVVVASGSGGFVRVQIN